MQLTLQDAFALAARHEAAGRGAEARAIYDEILASLPEHAGALLRIGEQALAAGRHDDALAFLQRALAAARKSALPEHEIWLALARVRGARGERDDAEAAIEQAHSIAKRFKSTGAALNARQLLEQLVAVDRAFDAALTGAATRSRTAMGWRDAAAGCAARLRSFARHATPARRLPLGQFPRSSDRAPDGGPVRKARPEALRNLRLCLR